MITKMAKINPIREITKIKRQEHQIVIEKTVMKEKDNSLYSILLISKQILKQSIKENE